MSAPVDLRALERDELLAWTRDALGEPGYRGEQLFRWVHGRGAASFAAMSDLGKALRGRLEAEARLGVLEVAEVQRSVDGTRKLRLVTRDGRSIESVLIPDGDKMTQCISTQVGCAMGCDFCATAKLGLSRNLDAGEIVDQVYRARALLAAEEPGRRITNLVYMGMGEPLHNYDQVMRSLRILTDPQGVDLSWRRITVSTVGQVAGLDRLGKEPKKPNLAVSLNASNDAVRDEVMPINRKWKIADLLAALRRFPLEARRRITFEYVLLAGVNDTDADAARLAKLLAGFKCKVNIIPWNPHPGAPYQRPTPAAIAAFQNRLKALGLAVYLRTPRGDDIDAACGQLANKSQPASGAPAGAGLVQLARPAAPPPSSPSQA